MVPLNSAVVCVASFLAQGRSNALSCRFRKHFAKSFEIREIRKIRESKTNQTNHEIRLWSTLPQQKWTLILAFLSGLLEARSPYNFRDAFAKAECFQPSRAQT